MRRAFGYAGAWLLATSVAAAVSWFGCALVLHQAAAPPPEVLSSMRRVASPGPLSGTTMVAGQAAANPASAPSRRTEPRASRSGRQVPTVSLDVQVTVRHSQPPARTVPSQQAAPGQAPSAGPAAVASTFTLRGGRATVVFAPEGVQVVAARPAPGYEWYIDQTQPDEVWVIFGRHGLESHLFATWDRRPSASVTEYWW